MNFSQNFSHLAYQYGLRYRFGLWLADHRPTKDAFLLALLDLGVQTRRSCSKQIGFQETNPNLPFELEKTSEKRESSLPVHVNNTDH